MVTSDVGRIQTHTDGAWVMYNDEVGLKCVFSKSAQDVASTRQMCVQLLKRQSSGVISFTRPASIVRQLLGAAFGHHDDNPKTHYDLGTQDHL